MKRSTLAVLLACAGLSGACSDSQVVTGVAGLSGAYDLTYSNGLVFVTSSDRDELRVLDLEADPKQFIPAPNPLEALSIPVIERPDALTRDEDFGSTGGLDIPYIYARSSGARQISVVAARRSGLKEVYRLEAGGLVTAFAARAPEGARAYSVLYYALQTPPPPPPAGVSYPVTCTHATIMRQELPGPDSGVALAELPAALPVFCLLEREAVSAMTVMPQEGRFVVATRNTTALPPALPGRTLLLAETLGGAAPADPVDLSAGFGGSPVRLLVTHPRVTSERGGRGTELLPAGRLIFGVRDETACGGRPECSGILAVDTASSPPGQQARGAVGVPMLPISPPAGLPVGLTLIPDARVRLNFNSGATIADIPLLGVMPASNGALTLFSANGLSHFDLDIGLDTKNTQDPTDDEPLPSSSPALGVELRSRAEVALTAADRPEASLSDLYLQVEVTQDPARNARFFEGSLQDGSFRIIYQGVLPGLSGLERTLEDPRRFEAESATAGGRVRVGDLIVLEDTNTECAAALTVTAVEAVPDTSRVRFAVSDTEVIPDECAGLRRFTVRTGGTQPFLLETEAGGFLSRDVLGTAYAIPTTYYFHAARFNEFPQPAPDLTLRIAELKPGLQRGDRFFIVVDSGIRTYVTYVNNDAGGLGLFTLPGPVVAPPGTNLAYIGYPSADGVLQMNMDVLVDNVPNSAPFTPFQ